MFITKKHIPRRTFLRGIGAAVALPLLDSMIPASTVLAQTAARSKASHGIHLLSPWRDHGSMDAEDRGQRLRDLADSPAARAL